jgi:hypothetical protein
MEDWFEWTQNRVIDEWGGIGDGHHHVACATCIWTEVVVGHAFFFERTVEWPKKGCAIPPTFKGKFTAINKLLQAEEGTLLW